MADNFPLTPGSGRKAATDEVTYSGELADVQLQRPVHVTGTEGTKTVVDLTDANGLKVQGGGAAAGDADAGSPLKIGGKATTGLPTPVSDGDRADAWFEADGAIATSNRELPRVEANGGSGWTNATAADTTLELDVRRGGTAILWIRPSGSITGGHLTFECTINGGTSWVPCSGSNGSY